MYGPFRYQATAGDCFPTSMVNALAALHPSDQLPSAVVQWIYLYALDVASPVSGGTSDTAASVLAHWLSRFGRGRFRVRAEVLRNEHVHLGPNNRISRHLDQGGVAVCDIKCERDGWHSVLALHRDARWVYFWDPRFRSRALRSTHRAEVLEPGTLAEPNLRIERSWLARSSSKPFTFGPSADRLVILVGRR